MSLDSMKRDLDNLQENIRKMQTDVESLTKRRDDGLRRIHSEYDNDIDSLNRRLQETRRREPELARQVRSEEEYERSKADRERRAT